MMGGEGRGEEGEGELPQSSPVPKNELLLPLAQLFCWSQQTDIHMDTDRWMQRLQTTARSYAGRKRHL